MPWRTSARAGLSSFIWIPNGECSRSPLGNQQEYKSGSISGWSIIDAVDHNELYRGFA